MIKSLTLFVFVALTFSCSDDTGSSVDLAILKACVRCNKSKSEMAWLRDLIMESETNYSLKGDFYAVKANNQITIVHQPYIMSCLACKQYDCNGNTQTPIYPLTIGALNSLNRIYKGEMK